MVNSRLHDMTSVERYVGQSVTYFICPWRRLRVTSREPVSFIGVWTSSIQIRPSKEGVGECNFFFLSFFRCGRAA